MVLFKRKNDSFEDLVQNQERRIEYLQGQIFDIQGELGSLQNIRGKFIPSYSLIYRKDARLHTFIGFQISYQTLYSIMPL